MIKNIEEVADIVGRTTNWVKRYLCRAEFSHVHLIYFHPGIEIHDIEPEDIKRLKQLSHRKQAVC